MLLKAGVDISKLHRECRRALGKIAHLYPDFVITSTYEGTHSAGSLHYANQALDIRHKTYLGISLSAERIRLVLGTDFDVVGEATHIHIEYDPK
jgi:hypothetical protein